MDIKKELKLSQQLVMTPQLQLAIELLSISSIDIGAEIEIQRARLPDTMRYLHAGEADPSAVPDEEGGAIWNYLDETPFGKPVDDLDACRGDIFVFGNPPEARANGRSFPKLRVLPVANQDHVRDAAWFVKALRQRARVYEKVVAAYVQLRPRVAITLDGKDVEPVTARQIAEAIAMHESTISRVATAVTMRNLHATFKFSGTKNLKKKLAK
jgi:hypothetical protein